MTRKPGRAFSCKFPDRARCRTGSCGPFRRRRSIIGDLIFADVGRSALEGMKTIFRTEQSVFIFPSSGTRRLGGGPRQHAVRRPNRVLMYETGHFAMLWMKMATRLGLKPEFIEGDWRGGGGPRGHRRASARGQGARDQGGLCGAQRDLHRFGLPHRRGAGGRSTRRATPALLMVDTNLGPRLDRLPVRRMGRRTWPSRGRRRG